MTRTSGGRLAAAIVVGLAVLPLSGCLYAQIPEHPDIIDFDPSPSAAPSDDPVDEPDGDAPSAMSFADGASLSASSYIQWGDGLMFDDNWKSVSPDDGNGHWTDGTVDGTCTAQFWQGFTSDVAVVAGDDSASSDAMIAQILGDATAAEITPLAATVQLGYQVSGNPGLDARQVVGANDGHDWMITTRAFTAAGAGVSVIVDCQGGDIDAVFAEVVEKNPILIAG
ncbi:MAG: hypothetical protein J7484_03485 [Microbacterium sp.]|nr:hypothetical protein [Microbacterium sp.]